MATVSVGVEDLEFESWDRTTGELRALLIMSPLTFDPDAKPLLVTVTTGGLVIAEVVKPIMVCPDLFPPGPTIVCPDLFPPGSSDPAVLANSWAAACCLEASRLAAAAVTLGIWARLVLV